MTNRLLPTAVIATLFALPGAARAEEKHDHKHDHGGHKHEHKEGEKKGEEAKEEAVQAKDVPAKVMAAFKRDYATAKEPKIEKETYKDGTVNYEFEFKDADGKAHEVEYNTDGEKLDDH